ncbi:MAG TPA: ATP-binding protein [Spirochaetia bacterium]|nr:ATP-binding protein [Spirochaetia bacterium]
MAARTTTRKQLLDELTSARKQIAELEASNRDHGDSLGTEWGSNSALLRNLFEVSPNSLYVKDTELRIVLCNETYARGLGKSSEELYGKTDMENGFPAELVNGRPDKGISGLERNDRKALSGTPVTVLGEIGWYGGETRVVDTVRLPLRNESGDVIGVFGTICDSADRLRTEEASRRSEQRYRSVVDSGTVGVYQSTLDGRMLFANDLCRRILEIESPEDLSSVNIYNRFKNSRTGERLKNLLRSDGAANTFESAVRSKTGSEARVLASATYDGSVVWGILVEISKANSDPAAVGLAQARLRNLSHRLLEAQENERKAIARELHDEIGQLLTATKIDLQVIRRDPLAGETAMRVDRSLTTIDRCLEQLRNLSLGLRPSMLDDLGLVPTLRWQAETLSARFGFAIRLRVQGVSGRFHSDIEVVCYRVTQEALTNAARHASASKITVSLRIQKQQLVLSINDDGVGFEVDAALSDAAGGRSFGLIGMQERAALAGGTAEITSRPGEGTTVTVRLPLRNDDRNRPQS